VVVIDNHYGCSPASNLFGAAEAVQMNCRWLMLTAGGQAMRLLVMAQHLLRAWRELQILPEDLPSRACVEWVAKKSNCYMRSSPHCCQERAPVVQQAVKWHV